MTSHQPGIFEEGASHHIFLEFTIRSGISVLPGRAPVAAGIESGDQSGHESGHQSGHQVVAFGPALADALAAVTAPSGDFGFGAIDGLDGMHAPATQRDLFVWLHGDRRDELFARALEWRAALAGVGEVAHEEHGFLFRDSRDLTGFVDGSANPKADARMAAALIGDGGQAGGSFVVAQRWVHDLAGFGKLPVGDQERVIGRTKPDSIELTGDAMPPDSHVSRTDLTRDGQAVKIYRRSSPVGGVRDAGLYFLAFSADVARFHWLLESMFGRTGDGLRDRLLGYSRPVTGSFFYAPPREALRAAFDG